MSYYAPFWVDYLPEENIVRRFDDFQAFFDDSANDHRKTLVRNFANPRDGLDIGCDFVFNKTPNDADNINGELSVGASAGGFSHVAGGLSHPGVLRASTLTSASGEADVRGVPLLLLGGGKIRFMCALQTEANLSSSAQRYDIQAGFFDSVTSDSTDGVYFRCSDDINSGKWELRAVNNGTQTVTDSGITVVASTWYGLEIEVNAAGTSAEGFIGSGGATPTSIGTVASNIPTSAGRETGFGFALWKSVGTTARTCDLDFLRVVADFTTAR